MMKSKWCASAYYLSLFFSCKFRMERSGVCVSGFFCDLSDSHPVAEKREAVKISYFKGQLSGTAVRVPSNAVLCGQFLDHGAHPIQIPLGMELLE